ncbi:MAG TPA: PAS domain S-box protein, partial [Alphaproteobacteria bacterium]|nr:PAS domain S-box protein [Alphaproteobacteria bacterium]
MSVSGVERASRALPSPPPAEPGRAEHELARISHRLLVLDADRIEEAVREELAATAVLADCDRSYLYFLDPARPASVWHAEWCADCTPGCPPPTDATRLGWARDRMLAGEVFHCHASRPLPEAARDDRATLDARGVRAALAIPMHAGERLIGAQVFERVHRDCGWSEAEIATLRTAGELLVSALKRWAADCALRESEERFRTITEYATELVAEFDDRGRYCYVSPSYATLLGHPPRTLLGQVGSSLIHPDDVEGSRQTFIRSFVEGSPAYSIHRLRHADGTWRWFENTGQAYRLASGKRRFVSIGHDVTQRIESQQALEHQLDLERTVARLSRRLLAVVDDRIEDEITASLGETAGLAGADRAYIARFPSGAS